MWSNRPSSHPFSTRRQGRSPALTWLGVALIGAAAALVASGARVEADVPGAASQDGPTALAESSLLTRVRASLQQERQRLLEHAYKERRRPLRVSALGKVTLGPRQEFDILPSADVDRPYRVLVAVDGRPATAEERREYARRHPNPANDTPAQRRERAEREAETRRKAEQRFQDAFRIYAFESAGTEVVDGVSLRQVRITPRPAVEPQSDMGKHMKKFTGLAWVDEQGAELVRLRLVATDTISIGWGMVGRVAEGTTITYTRKPAAGDQWFPASLRFEARGRTLLFRSFDIDTTTEWFDYRPWRPSPAAADTESRPQL